MRKSTRLVCLLLAGIMLLGAVIAIIGAFVS